MSKIIFQAGKKTKIFFWVKIFFAVIIAFAAMIFSLLFLNGEGAHRRDNERLDGLKAVREALFKYYGENGRYPSSASNWDQEKPDYGANQGIGSGDYDNLSSLISDFLADLPKDPLNPLNSRAVNELYLYRYVCSADGRNFAIIFETENQKDASPAVLLGW